MTSLCAYFIYLGYTFPSQLPPTPKKTTLSERDKEEEELQLAMAMSLSEVFSWI